MHRNINKAFLTVMFLTCFVFFSVTSQGGENPKTYVKIIDSGFDDMRCNEIEKTQLVDDLGLPVYFEVKQYDPILSASALCVISGQDDDTIRVVTQIYGLDTTFFLIEHGFVPKNSDGSRLQIMRASVDCENTDGGVMTPTKAYLNCLDYTSID